MENVTENAVNFEASEERILIRDSEGEVGTPKTKSAKMHPYQVVAATFADMTYNSRNREPINKWMTDVLRTISAINALPDYATGLRVDDVHYTFGEYMLPSSLKTLLCPAKVVLVDTPSAKDFLDRSQFKVTFGKVLTPEEVMVALQSIATKSRFKWNYAPIVREKVGLLTNETTYAVFANKVTSEKLDHIIYLNSRFDDAAQVDVNRWARWFATEIKSD